MSPGLEWRRKAGVSIKMSTDAWNPPQNCPHHAYQSAGHPIGLGHQRKPKGKAFLIIVNAARRLLELAAGRAFTKPVIAPRSHCGRPGARWRRSTAANYR